MWSRISQLLAESKGQSECSQKSAILFVCSSISLFLLYYFLKLFTLFLSFFVPPFLHFLSLSFFSFLRVLLVPDPPGLYKCVLSLPGSSHCSAICQCLLQPCSKRVGHAELNVSAPTPNCVNGADRYATSQTSEQMAQVRCQLIGHSRFDA
jgi:hypothetical protein